jgi:hypothetical protein
MTPQSEAKIFLAKNRSVTVADGLRSSSIFNSDNNKSGFEIGPFIFIKDDVLAAQQTLKLIAEYNADLMLLPVAGTIIYNDGNNKDTFIEPGNVQYFRVKKNDCIEILNLYEDEWINFLQLWIRPNHINITNSSASFSFTPGSNKNRLIKLFDEKHAQSGIQFFIGEFDGRSEALHKVAKQGDAVFIFVIEGAFEVQYRLIETRDALILWNIDEVEFEALSNNAIILVAEIAFAEGGVANIYQERLQEILLHE